MKSRGWFKWFTCFSRLRMLRHKPTSAEILSTVEHNVRWFRDLDSVEKEWARVAFRAIIDERMSQLSRS